MLVKSRARTFVLGTGVGVGVFFALRWVGDVFVSASVTCASWDQKQDKEDGHSLYFNNVLHSSRGTQVTNHIEQIVIVVIVAIYSGYKIYFNKEWV